MATAIGVVSGLIGIFSWAEGLLPKQNSPDTGVTFYLGNNGQVGPNGGVLGNADGTPPDVWLWSEGGDFEGNTVNDDAYCVSASVTCETKVSNTQREPTYALFTGNTNAVCIAWIGTTWPNGYKFGSVIGNWAEECMERHGVSQATWFYTNVGVMNDDTGYEEDVRCAWVDANGDQPTTGIQIHWPDFDQNSRPPAARQDTSFYCTNNVALNFHTDPDPGYVVKYAKKRGLDLNRAASRPHPRALGGLTDGITQKYINNLVKSRIPGQSATYLCSARGSQGPSFVSYDERKFCHMPTRTVWPFCEGNVADLACWNDELNIVVPGLIDAILPSFNFTNLVTWAGLGETV